MITQFRSDKVRALLIYLALKPDQPHQRRTLAGLLWPEVADKQALESLRTTLYRLRQSLDKVSPGLSKTLITVTHQTIDFNTNIAVKVQTDVIYFQTLLAASEAHPHDQLSDCLICLEQLTQASKLYQGELLPGFSLADAPAFEEWLLFQREMLHQQALLVFKHLADAYEARSDYDQAHAYTSRLLKLSPYREASHRQLMRLLAYRGLPDQALAQFAICQQLLRDEVGAEPEAETMALAEQIRQGTLSHRALLPVKAADEAAREQTNDVHNLKSRRQKRHNLPAQITAFIGRTTELAEIREKLSRPEVRLLTLTGPGGTGKTRLGLQTGLELLDDFADGVFFVTLAPISDSLLVNTVIAETLGVHPTGDRPVIERLKETLQDQHLLLILDNFEQVLEAAPMVTELLAAAPKLKVVTTSRTLLRLNGEWDYPVPPLRVPNPNNLPSLAHVTEYEAVQMFNERALAVKTDFALTEDNAPAVVEICIKLDGLPLAIELAAARIRLLPPQNILTQLSSRLKFLTAGARDLPARHQTLRNTIDWSYNLLETEEKVLFQRLAVFAGGCTIEAADAVSNIDEDMDVLNGLESLVDKNFIKQSVRDEPRFGMLETIREYGLERLTEHDEAKTIRKAHAQYFMELAEAAEPHMYARGQVTWVKRLETEHDNLRTALQWSIENDVEICLRLAGALGFFWHIHSHHLEGRDWLLKVLAQTEDSELDLDKFRAKALNKAGYLSMFLSNIRQANALLEKSVALWEKIGEQLGLAHALCDFGAALQVQPDLPKAREALEASIAIFRQLNNKEGLARSLFWHGHATMQQRDYEQARASAEECILLSREIGMTTHIGSASLTLGRVAVGEEDYATAQSFYEDSLRIFKEMEDKPGVAIGLDLLGSLAYRQAHYQQAKTSLEKSLLIWQELGNRMSEAWVSYILGYIAIHQKQGQQAASYLNKSLLIYQERNKLTGIARCFLGLAEVASLDKETDRAAQLFGIAEAYLEVSQVKLGNAINDLFDHIAAISHVEYEQLVAAVRAELDEASFEIAYAKGQAMSLEEAVAYALGQ